MPSLSIDENTARNSQVSESTLAARAVIRKRRRQLPSRRTPDMHDLVAEEMEAVIFGDSDDDSGEEWEAEDKDENIENENNYNNDSDSEGSEQDMHPTTAEFSRTENSGDSRMRRRRPRRRKSPTANAFADTDLSNINSYTLFELPGATRNRRSEGSSSSSIIYAKKYQSPGDILLPILIFLGGITVVLLVAQLLMSLFNAWIGVAMIILFVVKVVQDFLARPIRMIRTVHSAPVLYMTILGGVLGALYALWRECLPGLMSSAPNSGFLLKEGIFDVLKQLVEAISTKASSQDAQVDRIMMWGLLKGLIVGVELGCTWLIVFGDASKPTVVSKYLYQRVWRPLKRQYRLSASPRQHRRRSSGNLGTVQRMYNIVDNGISLGGDHRNQCAICFDAFQDVPIVDDDADDEGSNSANQSSPDRYQLLPCAHCFHRECARHWLSIQRTCPVCREKVEGMRGYSAKEEGKSNEK